MKLFQYMIAATLVMFLLSCNNEIIDIDKIKQFVPSLDEVSGAWMATDTMAIEPSIRKIESCRNPMPFF